ncbi:MAG: VCBS repeat-containing protein [Ruminococcaceae bacterium]|nr:VCBS repeat-containing protein [Oscillospiraceae bacterium]
MVKKMLAIIIALFICVLFTGCDIIDNTKDMVSPPELTGDMSPIADALYKSVGTNCDLKYPSAGDRRSAIIQEDINGDGVFEAFVFYSTNDDEMTTMHINIICQRDGKWRSVSDQTIVANGVEMVDFCDLDNDGVEEILIGWEVNGNNEKQLGVFTFDEDTLSQKLLQPYTSFMCCDLDSNGISEIFVHLLNTAEKTNKAMIYNYLNGEMAQTAGCVMDGSVKSVEKPILSTLSNGQKAIYIDEIKGVGSVTEVLYVLKGELINPLLDTDNSFENILTLRAASLKIQDINSDGIIEIPVASELPNATDSDEKLYYTNWCSFNGEKLSVKLVTLVNTVDGYYLAVPNSMVGYLAVQKDIDKHERKFYHFDSKNNVLGKLLFTVTAVDADDWASKEFDHGNKTEVARNDTMVFVVELGEGASAFAITIDYIKDTFNFVN